MKTFKMVLIGLMVISSLFAQKIIDNQKSKLIVQPNPKLVTSLNKSLLFREGDSFLPIFAEKAEEKKASNYLIHLIMKQFNDVKMIEENSQEEKWKLKIELKDNGKTHVNDQHYSIKCDVRNNEISITSPGQLGLLYGVVTFLNFIRKDNHELTINLFDVEDWPDYKRREVSAVFKNANVEELLNYALLNKIETLAIASRVFQWNKIEKEFLDILVAISKWKEKYGGPKIMLMQNIYDRKQIEISNPSDLDSLKNVIELCVKYGVDKFMILADDTPPFKYGDGYVLKSERDKKQFIHMADAHCYLMNNLKNWMIQKAYNSELYYVPPFYTYEDMNYGDMGLYKSTPWEQDAYKPLLRDLNYIGTHMPKDVFIIWCGPNVRSRKITVEDLDDWTKNLKGKIPYLWDNTIYSHHPFTSTPLFSAYDNELPADFHKRTAGNGMFVNGDANSEDSKAAVITTNDYLWNSQNYNPQSSIKLATERLYSEESSELLFEYKSVELELRKKIGERKLWFEADTLWSIIRKIRYITEKNPFQYHLNYSRLKTLRLQLKNSVPAALSKEEFIDECLALDNKRNEILGRLKNIDSAVYSKMKSIMVSIPDFTKIQ